MTLDTSASPRGAIVRVAALAGLGGLLFGYDTGVISGAAQFIADEFDLGNQALEIVVSAVLAGAILGALLAGRLSGAIGRRRTILLAAVLFAIGALGSAAAPSAELLIGARVVLGIAIGVTSLAVPLYISESAPAANRGALVTLFQLAVTVGILVATLVDEAFSEVNEGWRWMLGLAIVPAVLLFAGMLKAPPSPRWLVSKGRVGEAAEVLGRYTPPERVDELIGEIREDLSGSEGGTLRDLFAPALRSVLIIGVAMAIIQQITGINTVIYYDVNIFERAGIVDASDAILAAVVVAGTNVLATLIAIRYIDRVGRRRLLIVGMSGMIVGLVALGFTFALPSGEDTAAALSLLALVVYVVSFAFSLGPVVWVLISEIYPTAVRGPAMSVATMANWGANLLVALTFLTLLDELGEAETFWLYAGVTLLSLIFVILKVPETKGKTLEEIAADLGTSGEVDRPDG